MAILLLNFEHPEVLKNQLEKPYLSLDGEVSHFQNSVTQTGCENVVLLA